MKKQVIKICAISCVLLAFSLDAVAFGGRRGGGKPRTSSPFLAGMELRIRSLDEDVNYTYQDRYTGATTRYNDSSVVEVTLIRYRDCSAAPGNAGKDPSHGARQLIVFYSPTCCEAIIDTVYLDTGRSDKFATPLCPYNPAVTMCTIDTPYPGYKTEIYLDTLLLPCLVSDWRVGYLYDGDTTRSFEYENFLTTAQHPNGKGNAHWNNRQPPIHPWANYGGRNQTINQPPMGYGTNPNENVGAYIEMWYNNHVEQGIKITKNGPAPKYIANSTPISAANPLIFQCQNARRVYNLGYFDLDDHRMTYEPWMPKMDAPVDFFDYSFLTPSGAENPGPGKALDCNAAPGGGFDLKYAPLGPAPSSYNINFTTGEIDFEAVFIKATGGAKPSPVGKYKTAFRINEYDNNNVLAGRTTRDVVITIMDPPNCDNDSLVSNYTIFNDSVVNTNNCAVTKLVNGSVKTVEACAGTSNITFDVKAYTTQYISGSSLFIVAELPEALTAIGAFVTSTYTSSNSIPYLAATGTFHVDLPANIKPGIYPIVFQIRDCIDGYILSRTKVVNLRVNKKTQLRWYYTGFEPSITAPYLTLPDTGESYICGSPNMDILFLTGSSNDKGYYTWTTQNPATSDISDNGLAYNQPVFYDKTVPNTFCVKSDQYCMNTSCVTVKPVTPINPTLDVTAPDSCFNSIAKFEIKNLPPIAGLLFDWQTDKSEYAVQPSPFSNTAYGLINRKQNDFVVFVITPDKCIYPLYSEIPTNGIKPRFKYQTDKINVCPFVPIGTGTSLMTTSICGQSDYSRPYGPILNSTYPGNESNTNPTPKIFTSTANIDKTRTEFIYKYNELEARGFKPGYIKDISFFIEGISNPTFYSNITISARCTDKADLGDLKFIDKSNLMLLGSYTTSNLTTGWNNFSFSQPFTWDGKTNIIFDVQSYCTVTDQTPVPPLFAENLTTYISIIGQYGKGNKGFSSNPIVGGNLRPNIQWGYQNLDESKLKYSWFDTGNNYKNAVLAKRYKSWLESGGKGTYDTTSPKISATLKSPISDPSDPRYQRYLDSIPNFVVDIPTIYGVTVRDSNCFASGVVVADIDSNFKVSVTPNKATKCPGDTVHVMGKLGYPLQRFITTVCGDPDPSKENPSGDSCRKSDTMFYPQFGAGTVGNPLHSPFGGVTNAYPANPTTDKHIQILLTSNELKANPNMRPGFIQGIFFDVTNANSNLASAKLLNFSVSMKCVSSAMDSIASNNFLSTATFKQVYSGDFKPVFGRNYIRFKDTTIDRFGWDGNSGIMIDICFDNFNGASYNADVVASTNLSNKKRYLYRGTNVGADLGCTFATGVRDVIRPNVGLVLCKASKPKPPIPLYGLEWNPPTFISNTLLDSPIIYNQYTTKYYANLIYVDTNNGKKKTVCSVRDTILSVVDAPRIVFPYQVVACQGSSVDLTVGVEGMNSSLYLFEWDTFANGKVVHGLDMRRLTSPNQKITPPREQYYYVRVYSASNPSCWNRDSVFVHIQNLKTMPDIGSSTQLCPGQTLKLAIPTNVGYRNPYWFYNNRRLDTGYSLIVTQAGDYYVEVDSGACHNKSLIKTVTYRIQDTVRLPKTSFVACEGDSVSISYDVLAGVSNPIWNTGSTKYTIKVNQAGEYFLVKPKDMFGCNMINPDVAVVKLIDNPEFSLMDDTLCLSANEKVILKPNPFDPAATYTWEPSGTTSVMLEVETPNVYKVTRRKGTCEKVATAVVKNDEIGQVSLGLTTAVCCDEVITLDANPDGKKYTKYKWSSGDVSQIVYTKPNASGTYIVEAFRSNGCRDTGSIFIDSKCAQLRGIPEKKEIQLSEKNVMIGKHLTVKSSKITYQWIPSAEFNQVYNKDSLKSIARPTDTGDVEYVLVMTITDTGYTPNKVCVENDVVRFKVKPNSVDTFNAFTPNNDGLNDIFYPTIDGVVKVTEFKVYNRFGQMLHNDASTGWDGKYNGTPQPIGVYVGLLSYEFEEPRKPIVTKRKQIAITLVR